MNNSKHVSILVVDDDDLDVKLIGRAFIKSKIESPIYRAKNGIEALRSLRGDGGTESIPHPYIILLDLNMPKMNGLEFLSEIRNDNHLKDSTIFILSTSKDIDKIKATNKEDVAGYIVKPVSLERFMEAVAILDSYWTLCEWP